MLDNDDIKRITDSCRKAGVTLMSIFRAARINPSTFNKWRTNPKQAKASTVRQLRDGVQHMITELIELRNGLDARLGEHE